MIKTGSENKEAEKNQRDEEENKEREKDIKRR